MMEMIEEKAEKQAMSNQIFQLKMQIDNIKDEYQAVELNIH